MIAVGTVIAYWLDFGFSYVDNSSQWRFPISFQVVFAILLIAGVMMLPESPRYAPYPLHISIPPTLFVACFLTWLSHRWLLNHDQHEKAGRVLAALNGAPVNDPATLQEKKIIIDSIRQIAGMEAGSGFKDVFSRGKGQHLRRMLIGSSSQMFQQLGGCNAVIVSSLPLRPFLFSSWVYFPPPARTGLIAIVPCG